jgi:hypothetical protein
MKISIEITKAGLIRTVAAITVGALLTAGVTACVSASPVQEKNQALTEEAFGQQEEAVPYPLEEMTGSLERENLRERLLRYNDPDKISYIYLLSDMGGLHAYYTIKGKVSSNSSQMLAQDLLTRKCDEGAACSEPLVTTGPGDDGSYGPNEPGIFFFTTDGVMVTWAGTYLLTDAPMKINEDTLTLQYIEDSEPSSSSED